MEALLAEWGTEILFGLISAAVIGYAKWKNSQIMKAKDEAEKNAATLAEQKLDEKIDSHIEVELEPILQELEDLRKYCRDNENLEKSHMALIVASYRFRLVQLCKGFLNQGYITTAQMEQLVEFYKLYTGLGGNGQAEIYYKKAVALPLHTEDETLAP
jgi:predicted transcriptional regulator